jgi:hypothetical protein
MTTQTFSGFFEDIYREIVDLSDRTQPAEHMQVMRVLSSTRNFERFKSFAGLGIAQQKGELDPIPFDDMVEGQVREVSHETRARGFKISFEAMEDNILDVGAMMASSLGDVMHEAAEEHFAELWNNCLAGDTAPILTFDGLSIANAGHTSLRADGPATQSNLGAGDIGLGLIQAARYHYRNLRTDANLRDQGHRINKIIISPDATTEPILDQILNAPNQPFTADTSTPHELGAIKGGLQKVVYSYLDDIDRTIFLSQKAMSKKGGPSAVWRRRPSTTSWDDDSIQGSCFAGSFRSSRVCPDWRGIFVSAG